jgi:hypothetical protein
MRKIWMRFSDPWWKNVTSLSIFTWNIPYSFLMINLYSFSILELHSRESLSELIFRNRRTAICLQLNIVFYICRTLQCFRLCKTYHMFNCVTKKKQILAQQPFLVRASPFGISRPICFFCEVGLSNQGPQLLLHEEKPWLIRDSNPGPLGFKPAMLPTEPLRSCYALNQKWNWRHRFEFVHALLDISTCCYMKDIVGQL